MKTISKPHDNLGGLTKIWAIPSDKYSLSGKTVSISDSSNVYEIYCTPESMEFVEPKTISDAGIHYNAVVNGFTPGNTESSQIGFEYMEARKWVIVFKDGNGNYKAAGNQFEPLRLQSRLNSGKDTVGRSGYSFSFNGKTLARAKFIDNPF